MAIGRFLILQTSQNKYLVGIDIANHLVYDKRPKAINFGNVLFNKVLLADVRFYEKRVCVMMCWVFDGKF